MGHGKSFTSTNPPLGSLKFAIPAAWQNNVSLGGILCPERVYLGIWSSHRDINNIQAPCGQRGHPIICHSLRGYLRSAAEGTILWIRGLDRQDDMRTQSRAEDSKVGDLNEVG